MWRPTLLLVLAAGAFGYLIEEDLELLIVQTTTPQQVATLASFEEDYQLDFWTHPALNQWTMVAVPTRRHEELYQTWTNAGMTVNVREPNVLNMIERIKEKDTRYHLANRGKSRTEGLTLDHSRYYRNMLPELTTLKNTFPDLVFFDDSGNTPARSRSQADNRIIHVIELGANRGSTDVIMLEVNIHAREHITAAANLYFMDWVLSNYGSNENATFLLDNYHFVIMPVANPDGYDYSFVSSNTRLWRKNRGVNSGSSCRGTDLNRNFNANWLGGSSTRCSDTYRGASAGSEGESQAVMSVFNAFKDRMKVFMPVHAFSQLLLLPYSYSANPNQAGAKPPNQAKHYAAAIAMSAAMEDATGRFYTWGLPVETINYYATGTSGDWAILEKGNTILSIAYELRPDRNVVTSSQGFILDASEIVPAGKEYAASLIALGRYVKDNGTE